MPALTDPFPAPDHPGTIVIVDDEPLVLRALTRILHPSRYVIAPCVTPHEAIRHIGEGNVRAVVSDVSMPEISGIELLRMIREHDPDLPVIIVTGRPDLHTAAQAIEFGAFKYLTKPVDAGLFVHTVERAARLYRLAQIKRQAIDFDQDELGGCVESTLERHFEDALDQIWLAYQPIIRASDRKVYGYEALLRSNEPALRSPLHMLRAAERLGAVHRLGRAVRRLAADSMSSAEDCGVLFVNLHPRDLLDPDLLDERSALSGIADRVILEVTERADVSSVENAKASVSLLRHHGFRIAVDDLGAGYAGLNSFALLEPDFVKLDLALIRGVDSSPMKQKLVGSMASLCHDLGLSVIAEGIETRAERDTVINLGCDLLQGYLFASPGKRFPEARW